MTHQSCADPVALISVYDHKGHFGCSGCGDDVTSTANNSRITLLFRNRDQGDVINKIDIHEEANFLFSKGSFCSEKSPMNRLWTSVIDRLN